jgi:heat shock protein HslJ
MTPTRPHLGSFAAVVLTVSLAGVTAAQEEPASPEGTAWHLTAYATETGMTEPVEGADPTLLLLNGEASGDAGCNGFSGSYVLDGASLTFAPEMAQTMMACEPPTQAVEDAYLALLPTTASWRWADGSLQLLDPDSAAILEFTQAEPDIATVVALLEELRADVSALRARVDALEADTSADGEPDGTTTEASAPSAPRAAGSVQTEFPAWMRDGLPPDQISNKNREIVRWRDRAEDEAGYRVYARRGYCQLKPGTDPNQVLDEADFRLARTKAIRIDRLPADTTRYRPDHQAIDDALPEMPASPYSNDQFYDLYVAAFDDAGESERVLVGSFFLTPEFLCP